jgi:hypothetical protein
VTFSLLADLIVLVHIAFVLFVVLGGLLALWKPVIIWFHLPAALYGLGIELIGWICPLTPLENRFRTLAGDAGYEGGFIEHYAQLILYPANWHAIKGYLGAGVILINAAVYALVLLRRRRISSTRARAG